MIPPEERSLELFSIDFEDHVLGVWNGGYGIQPLDGRGFAHVVTNASNPGSRYGEHRPGFTGNGGALDVNWHGVYFTNAVFIRPGESLQLSLDIKLFARDAVTGMNWLDCFFTGSGRQGHPRHSKYFSSQSGRDRRVGFRLTQTPWRCAGRFPDGGLSVAMDAEQYWRYPGSINLNDIGISRLGRADPDIAGDPLHVVYSIRKTPERPLWSCSLAISNKVTGQRWSVSEQVPSDGAYMASRLHLGMNAESEMAAGEGFELDNLRLSILGRGAHIADSSAEDSPLPMIRCGEQEAANATPAVEYAVETAVNPPLFRIPGILNRMKRERSAIRGKLDQLPNLTEPLQLHAYGYHGGYLPRLDELPEEPRWSVELKFPGSGSVGELILVPAIDRRFDLGRSYGFPRRFRVLQVFDDGTARVAREWMGRDCPDPGRMPLSIKLPDPGSAGIRIEVFGGAVENGKELFALDEVFGVVRQEIYRAEAVVVNRELNALPYWGKDYLIDYRTSLGLPVGTAKERSRGEGTGDFSVFFEQEPEQPCIVEIDMGQNRRLGWVTLFPAMAPEGTVIPGYGFPGKIVFEAVREKPDGTRAKGVVVQAGWSGGNPGNNVVRIEGLGCVGRWMRFAVSDFPVHNGQRTFALGEIRFSRQNEPYAAERVKLIGFPEESGEGTGRLIDGTSNGRPVMFLLDWLRQLELRNTLTGMLEAQNHSTEALQLRWNRFRSIARATIVSLVILAAVCIALLAVFQRRRDAKKLRQQITQDLHDDIGSRLGAMSLVSTYLQKITGDARIHESSREMDRMAREMQVALADVLWFTNSDTDSLRQLVARLAEVAEQMVPKDKLELEVAPLSQIPDSTVKVMFKRDLLLVFKEMLHNAVRHSGATRIHVGLLWSRGCLTLCVSDNGRGFDVAEMRTRQRKRPHLGLNSMERRAERLSAKLTVDSHPGKGCNVILNARP